MPGRRAADSDKTSRGRNYSERSLLRTCC